METATGEPVAPDGPEGPRPRSPHGRRLRALGALAAAGGAVAYVGLVDPGGSNGVYPPCPSRLLLGLDCPACGGLRGTHDLLHGDVVGALDHNLLLPALLALYAYGLLILVAPLVGRAVPPMKPPRWLAIAGAVLLGGFMVLRNLPVAGLEFLDSGAS